MFRIEMKNRQNGKKCAVNVRKETLSGVSIANDPYEVVKRLDTSDFRKLWTHLGLNMSWEKSKCLEVVSVDPV